MLFGLFDKGRREEIIDVEMIDKKQKPDGGVLEHVVPEQLFRIRQNIANWRLAMSWAEASQDPNRTELLRLYKDTILDSHIKASMDVRISMTAQKPFKMVDEDGEIDDEWTEKFNRKGMSDIYRMILENVFYGFSLIQLGDVVDDTFVNPRQIPRQYLKPEKGIITKHPSDQTGDSFLEGELAIWTLAVGDRYYDLGLLSLIAPLYIIKKNNLSGWAQFSERYGEPMMIMKTDVTDQRKRIKIKNELRNRGAGAVSILNPEDVLEFINANTGSGFKTFEDLMNYIDGEVSKLVLGGTMLMTDGSSRSQAEVHERVAQAKIREDTQNLEAIVNGALISQMRQIGIAVPDGLKFLVENKEEVSGEELFRRVTELEGKGIRVDRDYITEKFGIQLVDDLGDEVEQKPESLGK